ncbi:MAG: gliding motility-associated ABC transporter substrate-binding protein GldG [Bacteroidota bacterium]|nr:gliding motility-associated ABC transporter substrate-binding protein GldG [Bacteroidota bacterium]
MISIVKKELHQFFSSLTGYITIIFFLLITGFFLFFLKDSNLFDFGYATLDQFFDLAPWIFIFLIPALCMRSFADEFRTGTFEILKTRPLSGWQIVTGKYFAVLIVIMISLLPTGLYVYTIHHLASSGGIDGGGIFGSYIGLLFLAGVFAAISLWCSSLTSNAVVAFLMGAFACVILYFGFNAISKMPVFSGNADYYLEMAGIDLHYRSISRGVVDTRDIIYFLSIIFLFLFFTQRLFQENTFKKGSLLFANKGWSLIIVLITAVILNLLAAAFHYRMDLTNEKRFTISSPVKKILGNINDAVEIDIFLKGDLPSGFKKLANTSIELLQEFKEYAHGNIRYKLISPESIITGTSRTYADTLSSLGLIPINLKTQLKAGEQSQYVYPAALIHYQGKLLPVNLYSGTKTIITPPELNSAEALLEYKFADAINKIVRNRSSLIAYSVGNGEPTGDNVYDLVENVLRKNYDLFTLNISKEPVIPDTFKLLMIVKPTLSFSEEEKLKIDQYIMHGGKVLWFIDRLEAEMDSLQIKNQVVAYDRNLKLEDLLFRYGIRINPDLLMDLQCDFLPFDVNGNKQYEFLHWNYFPLFESKQNSLINKNLGLVAGKFVNSIDTVSSPGIKKTILLSSSANARTIETPALISSAENRNAPEDRAFNRHNIPAAALLEGKFTSLYKNRISQPSIDSLAKFGSAFLPQSLNENKMIVVADGDIALNGVLQGQRLPMGVNPYTVGTQYEYQFANKQFVENCIEYLMNDEGLSEARGKDYTLRLLDPKKIESEKATWQIINTALPVFAVALFGVIYQWWRRRKYAAQ